MGLFGGWFDNSIFSPGNDISNALEGTKNLVVNPLKQITKYIEPAGGNYIPPTNTATNTDVGGPVFPKRILGNLFDPAIFPGQSSPLTMTGTVTGTVHNCNCNCTGSTNTPSFFTGNVRPLNGNIDGNL